MVEAISKEKKFITNRDRIIYLHFGRMHLLFKGGSKTIPPH